MSDGPFRNTDREIWREKPYDYYSPSISVTDGGGISINVGGIVITKYAREWHALAQNSSYVGNYFRGVVPFQPIEISTCAAFQRSHRYMPLHNRALVPTVTLAPGLPLAWEFVPWHRVFPIQW